MDQTPHEYWKAAVGPALRSALVDLACSRPAEPLLFLGEALIQAASQGGQTNAERSTVAHVMSTNDPMSASSIAGHETDAQYSGKDSGNAFESDRHDTDAEHVGNAFESELREAPHTDEVYEARLSRQKSSGAHLHWETIRGTSESLVSVYGRPVPPEQAALLVPTGGGGLVWHATLVPEDYSNPEDCDADNDIKPRRSNLLVRQRDFFSSLVRTADGRFMFSGVLNGWPGLACMELLSITVKARNPFGKPSIERTWNAGEATPPSFPNGKKSVRATLRMAPWTSRGWTKDAPGQVCPLRPISIIALCNKQNFCRRYGGSSRRKAPRRRSLSARTSCGTSVLAPVSARARSGHTSFRTGTRVGPRTRRR